jgi:hypothetical protein
MKISIIIPTLDRHAQLENLIGRLSEVIQNEELIIVDDSFASLNIGDLSTESFPIKYIMIIRNHTSKDKLKQ